MPGVSSSTQLGAEGGENRPQPVAGGLGHRRKVIATFSATKLVEQGRLAHISATDQGDEARAEAIGALSIMPARPDWFLHTLNRTGRDPSPCRFIAQSAPPAKATLTLPKQWRSPTIWPGALRKTVN